MKSPIWPNKTILAVRAVIYMELNKKSEAWKTFKKAFRTVKTFSPALTDAKFSFQRFGRKLAMKPHEKDFRVLAMFNEPKAQKDFVFVDIGANRGQTIDSVRLYKSYQIYSIEANTLLAEKIKNKYKYDKRVIVMNFAISDVIGEHTLYIPKYRNYIFDGLASLISDEAAGWLDEDKIYGFRKDRLSLIEMHVPGTTIDNLNLAPDFVKVDVQGAELAVLRGARKTLETFKPVLLVELPRDEAEGRFLSEIGYRAYHYKKGRFVDGISENGNSFFFANHHFSYFPPKIFNSL